MIAWSRGASPSGTRALTTAPPRRNLSKDVGFFFANTRLGRADDAAGQPPATAPVSVATNHPAARRDPAGDRRKPSPASSPAAPQGAPRRHRPARSSFPSRSRSGKYRPRSASTIVGIAGENADIVVLDTGGLEVRDGCTRFRVVVVET
jgi:hypothetical protein